MTVKIKKVYSPQEGINHAPGSSQAENTKLRENNYILEKKKWCQFSFPKI